MIKDILTVVLLLFAISGICDLIFLLKISLYMPKNHIKSCSVVYLNNGSALEELKYLWEKYRWHGSSFADTIIAFNDDISTEELEVCKKFCNGKNIVLTSSGENYSKWKTII